MTAASTSATSISSQTAVAQLSQNSTPPKATTMYRYPSYEILFKKMNEIPLPHRLNHEHFKKIFCQSMSNKEVEEMECTDKDLYRLHGSIMCYCQGLKISEMGLEKAWLNYFKVTVLTGTLKLPIPTVFYPSFNPAFHPSHVTEIQSKTDASIKPAPVGLFPSLEELCKLTENIEHSDLFRYDADNLPDVKRIATRFANQRLITDKEDIMDIVEGMLPPEAFAFGRVQDVSMFFHRIALEIKERMANPVNASTAAAAAPATAITSTTALTTSTAASATVCFPSGKELYYIIEESNFFRDDECKGQAKAIIHDFQDKMLALSEIKLFVGRRLPYHLHKDGGVENVSDFYLKLGEQIKKKHLANAANAAAASTATATAPTGTTAVTTATAGSAASSNPAALANSDQKSKI